MAAPRWMIDQGIVDAVYTALDGYRRVGEAPERAIARLRAERDRMRAAKAARQSAFPWSAEDCIRALPLDGGDHG